MKTTKLLPWTYDVRDDGKDDNVITFKWHFPRGTLEKRMSGLELARFVLEHMGGIIGMGLFDSQPKIKAEFTLIASRVVTMPQNELDEVLAWLQPCVRMEEDDVIFMSAFAEGVPTAPQNFLVGG